MRSRKGNGPLGDGVEGSEKVKLVVCPGAPRLGAYVRLVQTGHFGCSFIAHLMLFIFSELAPNNVGCGSQSSYVQYLVVLLWEGSCWSHAKRGTQPNW